MVPYWKFQGEGIAATITQETGRRALVFAYLPAGFKERQAIKVLSRGKFLSGQVVKRHLSAVAPPYARPVHVREIIIKKPRPLEPLEFSVQTLWKKAIQNTAWRQRQTFNLIPSEQTPSPLVKLLSIADPSARYAEHRLFKSLGDAEIYYYQGTSFIEEVEAQAPGRNDEISGLYGGGNEDH